MSNNSIDKNTLRRQFFQQFGREDAHQPEFYFAPGRVCLIGEHIDYNGGLVMPAAISLGIHAVYRKEDNGILWMRSTLDSRDVVFNLNQDIVFDKSMGWGNYPLGVLHFLRQQGFHIGGCEILFHSNLPVGAGLSSSAAVEVLTAYIFSHLAHEHQLSRVDMALLAKKAENNFVGVQCGIMDQFAVAMGKKNHAMVLNCDTLEHEYVPISTDAYSVVVMNSNKSRELAESKFNERTAQCAAALKIVQQFSDVTNLAEADEEVIRSVVNDPILQKRALHVTIENQRVKASAIALKSGDLATFGQLMTQSHQSLKNNYEVSGLELDTLVEAAVAHPACLGAKMTGAGFGGCAVAIVNNLEIDSFTDTVLTRYQKTTHRNGAIFKVDICDGVGYGL